jgi:hypothetical protein
MTITLSEEAAEQAEALARDSGSASAAQYIESLLEAVDEERLTGKRSGEIRPFGDMVRDPDSPGVRFVFGGIPSKRIEALVEHFGYSSADDFLEAKLEHESLLEDLRAGIKDFEEGRFRTVDEVFAEILAEAELEK